MLRHELEQRPQCLRLHAVFSHGFLRLIGLHEVLELLHVRHLKDEACYFRILRILKSADLDTHLGELLVPAPRSDMPGLRPALTSLNFMRSDYCCHEIFSF
jgi:hypothetical protein